MPQGMPAIGDTISTEKSAALCARLGLDHLTKRIRATPELFESWKFDGVSTMPDKLMAALTGCDWHDLTYKCALPHDLAYAYGDPGNDAERKRVDEQFYSDLINKAGMNKACAWLCYLAVRGGGSEMLRMPFSWAFARKRQPEATLSTGTEPQRVAKTALPSHGQRSAAPAR